MKRIGKYTVEDQPLARGGMGQIFKGYDDKGMPVAIKEILPEFATDYSIVTRLEKEVEFLMKVNHDYIVKLYDAFRDTETQTYYIVMEFVDGKNVEQYVSQNGAIPPLEAVDIMIKVLEALQQVHDAGIVHRDLKPSNIMILPDMSVRLLDFGVAKDMEGPGLTTIPGSVIGTTGYMSPEQAEGYSINTRSDIYSLGCVFFYMLTGKHAFNTLESEFETKEAILNQTFPRLSKYKKGLPDKLQKILDKATQRDMRYRYESCQAFLSDLRNETFVSVLTVGRDNCDIIINDSSNKISRHHLDIERREFTGGRYYVITDVSSNGTMVGGRMIHRSSISIPDYGPFPEVRLANVEDGILDWEEVSTKMGNKGGGRKISPDPPKDAGEDGSLYLVLAYMFVALGGVLGIAFGIILATSKVRTPDGRTIYKYKKLQRQLGLAAIILSPISILIWLTFIFKI